MNISIEKTQAMIIAKARCKPAMNNRIIQQIINTTT